MGTEHVLLGLYAEPEGIAAKALIESGLSGDDVEAAILAITPRGEVEVGAPPFTPRAAACLEKALSEALQLGHNYIGTEHILLGLFTDPDGLAARIMSDAGVTHDAIAQADHRDVDCHRPGQARERFRGVTAQLEA